MRPLRPNEMAFIKAMLKGKPNADSIVSSLPDHLVEEMDDGGMGGLTFVSSGEDRSIGVALAETQFVDEDGVTVIATLNLDNHNELYELDIWKVDFSPLKRLPDTP